MEYHFSDLFTWTSGKPITPTTGVVPVYGSNGIIGFTDEAKYHNKIILGRVGAYCGSVAYCPTEFNATDNTLITTCDTHKIIYAYAYYLLKQFNLNGYAGGSAQPLITQGLLKHLKCEIPSTEEQKTIVDYLSAYDNLIEVNNKRIKLLEQMAENLYKEWFVRFRFPGHKTAEFENGIPKGWEYERIGNFATVKSGYSFKSEWWSDEGIPAVKIKDIGSNTVDLTDLSRVDQKYADKAKQFYVSAGDLLIALTGATIGKIALVPYTEKMTVNQRVGKFFFGNEPWKSVAFLYCFFLQDAVQEEIVSISASNAAQPNISPTGIENIKTYYNKKIVREFNELLSPVILNILKLRNINNNLMRQRDLLLPRLMSGKLEV